MRNKKTKKIPPQPTIISAEQARRKQFSLTAIEKVEHASVVRLIDKTIKKRANKDFKSARVEIPDHIINFEIQIPQVKFLLKDKGYEYDLGFCATVKKYVININW